LVVVLVVQVQALKQLFLSPAKAIVAAAATVVLAGVAAAQAELDKTDNQLAYYQLANQETVVQDCYFQSAELQHTTQVEVAAAAVMAVFLLPQEAEWVVEQLEQIQ
jgi:hypothetical protein